MYTKTTTASRRAAARANVRYSHVSVPLLFIDEQHTQQLDGTVTITPAHFAASSVHSTINVGSSITKGYKRALRVARRRVMRVMKQQGNRFEGAYSLNKLMGVKEAA